MQVHRTKILGFSLLLGGLMLCGIGLWLLLSPAQYRAEVKIIIMPDVSDIEVYQKNHPGAAWYDPYFIQTTFEIIRSPAVLSNVVEGLNLNDRWGKKYSWSGKLEIKQTVKLLRKRMNVQAVSNTKYLKISVTSEDADEAAQLANAIAQSYQNYRWSARKQLLEKGIEVLEEEFKQGEQEIKAQREKVERLKRIVPEPVPTLSSPTATYNPLPDTINRKPLDTNAVAYLDAARKLETMEEFHKLLAAKIEAEKSNLSMPRTSTVAVVDPAVPPQTPIGTNRVLGALLLAFGLFLTVGGILLLKSSRHQLT